MENICYEFSEEDVVADSKSMTINTIIHKKYFQDFSKKIAAQDWMITKVKRCQFLMIIEIGPSFF